MIIVTGLPRSGTSLLCRFFLFGGLTVATDNKRKPDRHNPYGYFEIDNVGSKLAELEAKPPANVLKVTYPIVKGLTKDHQYVFIKRNSEEIRLSQNEMREDMRGKSLPLSYEITLEQSLKEAEEYFRNKECIWVDFKKAQKDPRKELYPLKCFVLNWKNAWRGIDEKLYRHKAHS